MVSVKMLPQPKLELVNLTPEVVRWPNDGWMLENVLGILRAKENIQLF